MKTLASLALLGLIAVAGSTRAAESYDNCTGFIDSLPAYISTQGTWCLRKDLSTAATNTAAIFVATNNVTIDCNDFKLGGLGAGLSTTSAGIRALERQNTTVRNCNIRGFLWGVQLRGGGHVVEDNRFDGNTQIAIEVEGAGSIIRRNMVSTTGGSLHPEHWYHSFAISTDGDVDVIDNIIDSVAPNGDENGNGSATGIYMWRNLSGTASGNRVRGVMGKGVAADFAIASSSNGRAQIFDNVLTSSGRPVTIGISCNDAQATAARNLMSGFSTAMQNCADGGGNFAN